MSEKGKRQHSLPNRQLALAFRFSATDLAANRNGYITRAQQWSIPLWLRSAFQHISVPTFSQNPKQRQRLETLCGRAKLSYEQQQIQSLFHADFVEVYKLSINALEFRITALQHQALGEGLIYRLYYNPDDKQILSLERAINGCSES